MSIFFMTQPLAAVAEALSFRFYQSFSLLTTSKVTGHGSLEKHHEQQSRTGGTASPMPRIIGYIWVFWRLGAKHKILCFEMEAAGVMNTIPCMVLWLLFHT
jgi:hypothetical protein